MVNENDKYFGIKHVNRKESACRCGCGENNVDMVFLQNFDKFIEDHFNGHKVNVHCLCRCRDHNKKVGGAINSYHLSCKKNDISAAAIDFDVEGFTIEEAIIICNVYWNGGVEQGTRTWVHVDGGANRRFGKPIKKGRGK